MNGWLLMTASYINCKELNNSGLKSYTSLYKYICICIYITCRQLYLQHLYLHLVSKLFKSKPIYYYKSAAAAAAAAHTRIVFNQNHTNMTRNIIPIKISIKTQIVQSMPVSLVLRSLDSLALTKFIRFFESSIPSFRCSVAFFY